MKKIISFMHISLDGYVAGPKGELNWVKLEEEIFDHVEKRISQTNTALYGRVTFEMMENYWPHAADKPSPSRHDINHSRWYKNAHKIVLSKTLDDKNLSNTTVINDNLPKRLNEIKITNQDAGNEILLFGSPAATKFLIKENLIDGYWLFVNPVILGQGIPLFKDNKNKTKLRLTGSRPFDCGVIELMYLNEQH